MLLCALVSIDWADNRSYLIVISSAYEMIMPVSWATLLLFSLLSSFDYDLNVFLLYHAANFGMVLPDLAYSCAYSISPDIMYVLLVLYFCTIDYALWA